MGQNIYDCADFFEGYKAVRENPLSYNELLERPALRSLLPGVRGLRVLDLGCGMGEGCRWLLEQGAKAVVGVDQSARMLEEARAQGPDRIAYYQLDLAELDTYRPETPFDLAVSSLCFHYLPDYPKLLADIRGLLRPGGLLVFSQEHPMVTAPRQGELWERDEQGEILCGRVSDYGRPGLRVGQWLGQGVEKYHRTAAQLLNGLVEAGFVVERMEEACPTPGAMAQNPRLAKEVHRPCFIFFRARRRGDPPGG